MSTRDDGGPAFPVQEWNADGTPATLTLGLSLRDYFAAAALTGISAHPSGANQRNSETVIQAHARWAYEMADAMLIERQA